MKIEYCSYTYIEHDDDTLMLALSGNHKYKLFAEWFANLYFSKKVRLTGTAMIVNHRSDAVVNTPIAVDGYTNRSASGLCIVVILNNSTSFFINQY